FSLIDGVSNLSDVSRLSRIGGKTIAFYFATTVIAISVGLVLVNIIRPGKLLSEERRESLREAYASELGETVVSARELGSSGPLQPLVDIVPDNFFSAASSNSNMLQIIFFAILFGVAMILTKSEKIAAVQAFFDGTSLVILRMVDIIMQFAAVGV